MLSCSFVSFARDDIVLRIEERAGLFEVLKVDVTTELGIYEDHQQHQDTGSSFTGRAGIRLYQPLRKSQHFHGRIYCIL